MRDITLSPFDSAVFLARMEYTDSKKRKRIIYPYELKDHKTKYTDEYRIKRWQYENDTIDYILDYLEKHYPDNDYANKFMQYKSNNEWRENLSFPTAESKNCEYHTDEYHCKLKRTSGCYTCCFVCFSPGVCEWSNCKILRGEMKNL